MDFFIAPHIFGDDFGDLEESGDEKEDSEHLQSPEEKKTGWMACWMVKVGRPW